MQRVSGAWRHAVSPYHRGLCRCSGTAGAADEERRWRRAVLERVADQHGVQEAEHWKRVTTKHVLQEEGGSALLRAYGSSVYAALVDLFPEQRFHPLRCRPSAPRGYWDEKSNRRAFLDEVARARGLDEGQKESWQQITRQEVEQAGGSSLLRRYGGTLQNALRDIYPELGIEDDGVGVLCGGKLPRGYWEQRSHRRRFLSDLADKRGIDVTQRKAWKDVTTTDVLAAGGRGLLHHFSGSLFAAVADAFPEVGVTGECVGGRTPNGYWEDVENCRSFMDAVGEEMGVEEAEDWRKVTYEDVASRGGRQMLRQFDSLFSALLHIYPEYRGRLNVYSDTQRLPAGQWAEGEQREANVASFVAHVQKELGIASMEEWKRVSNEQLASLRGWGLLQRGLRLIDMLRIAYPGHTWAEEDFTGLRGKRATQRTLFASVRTIFC